MFILFGMRGRNGEIGYGVYVMECPGMCGIIGMYWIHRVWHGLCGSVGWGDWSDHVQPQARGGYGAGGAMDWPMVQDWALGCHGKLWSLTWS